MKRFFWFSLIFATSSAFAGNSMIWICSSGKNGNALTVENNPSPGEFSYLLKVNDSEICKNLGLPYPSVFLAKSEPNDGYIAIPGEYSTGVVFRHDHSGMKLSTAWMDREHDQVKTGAEWYFNPGECVPQ